ncbi:MAG: hypothetical protein IT161_03985 [Bryobacterales bacterium]|nr:hypothetical protein [Bryobacterales bacterium]
MSAEKAGAIRYAADWNADNVVVNAAGGVPLKLKDCSNVRIPTGAATQSKGAAPAP